MPVFFIVWITSQLITTEQICNILIINNLTCGITIRLYQRLPATRQLKMEETMPDFQTITVPASRAITRTVRIGIVDLMGATKNTVLNNIGSGVTDAQINALRTAIGNASNGGVYFDEKTVTQQQAPRDSRAFSDPHSSVSDLGVMVFKHPNPQVEDVYLDIPAIDVGKINDAGGLNMEDAELIAIRDAALPILNDSNPFTGNYFFSHAYYSDRKGSSKKYPGNIPTLVEPRGTPET